MRKNLLFLILLLIGSYAYADFVDINAGLIGVESSSTAWGDIDNDGDLDLVVTGKSDAAFFSTNIYRNDGGNVFTNINAGLTGVIDGSASWGDYNKDGYIDLVISGQNSYSSSTTTIYRNNGDYTFTDINAGLPGVMYSSTAWGDFDNDGDLDLLLAGATTLNVYRNNGNGTFTNINAGLTGITYSAVTWGDYDNDGDLDILATGVNVATDYTKLYKNNGNSTFTEVTTSMMNLGYGSISWGDYDNDGDLDVLLTGNSGDYNYTKVYRNDGNNVFTDIGAALTGVGWGSAAWGDYDADGKLDVLLEGHTGSAYISRIYHNNGSGSFSDIGAGLINVSSGSTSWADFDNDGKLDFILTGSTSTSTKIAKIYRNNFTGANTAPAAPTNLHTYTDGSFVVFTWTAPTDAQTPSAGLTYQLRLGTTPGGSDIISSMSTASGMNQIAQFGYSNGQCTWKIQGSLLSSQFQYYWSVQAIDNDFAASPFAAEAMYKKIQVLSPNGGETWMGNTNYTVHWVANPSITSVNVFASIDGNWVQQNSYAISAALGYYTFRIFNTASTTAQVKVVNSANTDEFDTSDSYFNISTTAGSIIQLYQFSGTRVQVGKTYYFSWNTVEIDNIKIEYSSNAGSDWQTIASSVPATDGVYYWTIPNTPSANCYLRISDAANPNTYAWGSPFTICSLEITSPNGAEFLQTGTVKPITWRSNQISSLKLEYSADNGGTWNTIIGSVSAALGTYNWTIPATASNQYLVRASAIVDLSITDASNAVFTAASLTLTNPTASGIKLQGGKTYAVTWSQQYMTGFIKLDYSTNGGSTYTAMTWGLTADLGSYNWTVPATASTNCKIRISSMDFPTFTNTSTNPFTIATLALTSPNGSEVWGSQNVHNITWNQTNITNMKLEYSSDNGSNWNQIVATTPASSGTYSWTVPTVNSTSYLVRASDASYSTISDMSDNIFTVRPQLILTSPNGGENWVHYSQHPILWSATTDVANVNLDYSLNNGTDWLPIQASYPASEGTYNWTIPVNPSMQCLVKVSNAAMSTAYDESDSVFTIPVMPPIADFSAHVQVGYAPMTAHFTDQSLAGSGIITNWLWNFGDGQTSTEHNPIHLYDSAGYYTVSLTVTNSYDSTSTITKTDFIHVLPSEIVVTFPNGGEVLPIGSVCSISWTATPNISQVNIEYSVNHGTDWLPIQSSFSTTAGTYDWTIPDNASTQCLVRVSNTDYGATYDISDTTFTIPVIPPTADFTANITEGYEPLTVQFTDHSIAGSGNLTNWLWNFGDGSTSTEQNPEHIYATDGFYTVTLKVTNSYDSTSTLVRTDYIHVLNSELTLTAPNGGEILTVNSHYSINWTNTENIDTIHIFYSTHDGMDWIPVILAYPCVSGSYDWTVPNNVSADCRIRIIDAVHSSNVDTSDLPFTIRVIPPTAAFIADITEGYQPLGVDFADQSIAGTGTITNRLWNFGDGTTSTELYPHHEYLAGLYTVTLTVTNSYDSTDTIVRTDFIHVMPSVLTLDSPNGGETIHSGTVYQISWTATPNIQHVKLDYSINGGSEWLTIAASVPAYSGAFQWMVPNNPSANCLVMISNVDDLALSDWSNASFTIPVILPTADFTSTATEGYTPWAVQFNDNSTPGSGTITNWLWNFGDGDTSPEQNPVHTYSGTGYFTVTLTVTNSYDSTATITKTDYIHVLPSILTLDSPNGGETINSGTVYQISWTATPDIHNVKLDYSINGGSDWQTIAESLPASTGSFQWMVPNNPSANCLVMISNVDDLAQSDWSNASFTIPVIPPIANFNANATEGYQIFAVQFSDNSVAGSGTITQWSWNFGDDVTSDEQNPLHYYAYPGFYSVSLTVTNSYGSTETFTRTNYIHVLPSILNLLTPNGGEILNVDSTYAITWTATPNIRNIHIEYSLDGVNDWQVVALEYPASAGVFNWTVPGTPTSNCRIRMWDLDNSLTIDWSESLFTIQVIHPTANFTSTATEGYAPCAVQFTDASVPGSGTISNWLWNFGDGETSIEQNPVHTYSGTGYFTVTLTVTNSYDSTNVITKTDYIHVMPSEIHVLAPVNGEILPVNSNYTIQWTATPDISSVNIYYNTTDGAIWNPIILNCQANRGMLDWTVPNEPSTICRVEITNSDNSDTFDIMGGFFIIPALVPTTGFTSDVTEGYSPLEVHFTDTSVAGSGMITSWNWNFGDGTTSTEQNPTHTYTEEGYFNVSLTVTNSFDSTAVLSINNYIHVLHPNVAVLAPNGGETLVNGAPVTILWAATPDIENVKIEYTVNHGLDWFTITDLCPASPAGYEWLVPDNPSAQCLVRISDTADSTIFDVSDTTFTIPANLPTANFTSDITEAQQPLTVQFTDQSTPGSGILANWLWNFGDTFTSTEQNPSHLYTLEGYYTVTLTVTNSYDSTASVTKTDYIHVLPNYPLIQAQIPEPMAFGLVYLGLNSDVKTITLQNTGTATLHISSSSFHLSSSPFSVEGITLPASVEPGNSTVLQVRFIPQAVGSVTDTLFIHNDSTNEPLLVVPLSGYSEYVPPKAPENLTLERDEHNINLYWDPVTEDIMGRPVDPDYYIVFYNDGSSPDGTYYYCGGSVEPYYIDMGVLWHSKTTLYHVRAFHTDGRRSLAKLPHFTKNMTEEEVLRELRTNN